MTATADSRPAPERVLEAVRAARAPVTAGALARSLGVHATTVRFHLERLERAGRVIAEPAPAVAAAERGRGRPARRYRAVVADDARARMIDALADASDGPGTVRERAARAGEAWGASMSSAGAGAAATLTSAFAALGFAPVPTGDRIVLRACPFLEAARRRPDVVCAVHLGLATAIAVRGGAAGVRLEPFTPDGCRLTIER